MPTRQYFPLETSLEVDDLNNNFCINVVFTHSYAQYLKKINFNLKYKTCFYGEKLICDVTTVLDAIFSFFFSDLHVT